MRKKGKKVVIGVPKEIRIREGRVGLTPEAVGRLIQSGKEAGIEVKVIVQAGAGVLSGFFDGNYRAARARIVKKAAGVYARADIIVKVKEPLPPEFPLLKRGQAIFTYLHPAANHDMIFAFLNKNILGVSYDTVSTPDGWLPLLQPMSEVAGALAIDKALEIKSDIETVTIIGAGTAGLAAMNRAFKRGLSVRIMDIDEKKLRIVKDIYPEAITAKSTTMSIIRYLGSTDLLVGAVLKPGCVAPKIIARDMLRLLRLGSVIVDIAIDQGGCCETSRPTTHDNPTFEQDGIIHYCVANMPGCVPKISTPKLVAATLPYLMEMIKKGLEPEAILDWGESLRRGVVTVNGYLTNKDAALALMTPYVPLKNAING